MRKLLETIEVNIYDEVSASLSLVIKNLDNVSARWEKRWGSSWDPQRAHDRGVEAAGNFGVQGLPPRLLVETGLTLLDGHDLESLWGPLEPLTKEEKGKLSVPLISRGLSGRSY